MVLGFWESMTSEAACQQLQRDVRQSENDLMSPRSILPVAGLNFARNQGSITAFSSRRHHVLS